MSEASTATDCPITHKFAWSYLCNGRRQYVVSGGGVSKYGNATGKAEVTDKPEQAMLFASEDEAADALPAFSGWVIGELQLVPVVITPAEMRQTFLFRCPELPPFDREIVIRGNRVGNDAEGGYSEPIECAAFWNTEAMEWCDPKTGLTLRHFDYEKLVIHAWRENGCHAHSEAALAPEAFVEPLVWVAIDKEMPDADITVLGWRADWDEVEKCYLSGTTWILARRTGVRKPPTHWAHLPAGPKMEGKE